MPDIPVPGCRTTPLAGYLSALGLLRIITRTFDPDSSGHWHRQRFVLRSTFTDLDALVDELHRRFEPAAIVSPWNEGAGLRAKPANRSAAENVDWLRATDDPRLAGLRDAVRAGDRVIGKGLANGWGGSGGALWDKKYKPALLRLCRNELPDEALAWLDVAAVLGQDGDVSYSRLLGAGGVFGRQEISATYLTRVREVFVHRNSRRWLAAALGGDETVPYLRGAVGQFDPGRAGGIQSSPLEKADDSGFVNPWTFLLTLEGVLLFASAVVRRHGAEYAAAALPFQVRGLTAGHASAAPGEQILGEFWAPEWARSARIAELAQLFGEGRARWRGRPAQTALDMARAIANLGVERDIHAFQRYVFVDRLGQNPLAVPASRIRVGRRSGVGVLAQLDPWLDAVRRGASTALKAKVRGIEQALFAHAASGEPADLVEVFATIGRCHEALARSTGARQGAWPLVLHKGKELYELVEPALEVDGELRVALALATAHDVPTGQGRHTRTMYGLRTLLSPIAAGKHGSPEWSERPIPASLLAGLPRALAAAARLRSLPRTEPPVPADEPAPAVRGTPIAFKHGLRIRPSDVMALVSGLLDDERIADLLAGLLTVDWAGLPDKWLPGTTLPDPVLDLLLPFGATDPVSFRTTDDTGAKLVVRPGSSWPTLLSAERVNEVIHDAVRRLRLGGVEHVITPRQRPPAGDRLAALLLFRTPDSDRRAMLRRIGCLPQPPKPMEEVSR